MFENVAAIAEEYRANMQYGLLIEYDSMIGCYSLAEA